MLMSEFGACFYNCGVRLGTGGPRLCRDGVNVCADGMLLRADGVELRGDEVRLPGDEEQLSGFVLNAGSAAVWFRATKHVGQAVGVNVGRNEIDFLKTLERFHLNGRRQGTGVTKTGVFSSRSLRSLAAKSLGW